MLGRGLGSACRLAGQAGRRPCRLGQLPRHALELAGRGQHVVDDAADAGFELIDEAPQFGLALLGGSHRGRGLLLAQAPALGDVVLEDLDGSRDLADLVHPLVVIDLDAGVAVGNRRQRLRDRAQGLGDAAHDHRGQEHHQNGGEDRPDRHGLDRVRQHGVELRHRNPDIENADHLSGRIGDRVIGRHERLAEQRGLPLVGLATAQDRLSRVIRRELGADGAVAVFLLDVGGTPHELAGCLVIDEQGRVAADIADRAIDDRMILEFRHARNFGVGDDAILQGDLGVAERLGERQRQGPQVDLDVAQRAVAELGGQRPIGRPHHQRGVHRDQKRGGDHRLGAKPELERRQVLSNRARGHHNLPKNALNLMVFAYDRLNGTTLGNG